MLSLETELKRLRFSATQRESLDRHINDVLNVGEHAGKLVRSQVERFEQHTTQSGQLVEDLEQEVMAARLLPICASRRRCQRWKSIANTAAHASGTRNGPSTW